MDNCGLKLYSDDTEGKLQASVNMCTRLCSVNALTINIKRTKNMAFFIRHRVKKCKNASINIDKVKLKLVPSFRFFFVFFSIRLFSQTKIKFDTCFHFLPGSHAIAFESMYCNVSQK